MGIDRDLGFIVTKNGLRQCGKEGNARLVERLKGGAGMTLEDGDVFDLATGFV